MAREVLPGVVQSINSKVDLVKKATSFHDFNSYGQIMVGNNGFEYYNDRNVKDFIQIPWSEVDLVIASVMFGGRSIPRFAIQTKSNGTFTFSSRDPKETLRAIRKYVPADHMVRSPSFFDVIKTNIKMIGKKKPKKD